MDKDSILQRTCECVSNPTKTLSWHTKYTYTWLMYSIPVHLAQWWLKYNGELAIRIKFNSSMDFKLCEIWDLSESVNSFVFFFLATIFYSSFGRSQSVVNDVDEFITFVEISHFRMKNRPITTTISATFYECECVYLQSQMQKKPRLQFERWLLFNNSCILWLFVHLNLLSKNNS